MDLTTRSFTTEIALAAAVFLAANVVFVLTVGASSREPVVPDHHSDQMTVYVPANTALDDFGKTTSRCEPLISDVEISTGLLVRHNASTCLPRKPLAVVDAALDNRSISLKAI